MVALRPAENDWRRLWRIEASGRGGRDGDVVARTMAGFQAGTVQHVYLQLEDDCIGVACGGLNMTCRQGRCQELGEAMTFDPTRGFPDGGVGPQDANNDSGPLDSGPLDSGPLDSGPLDSGPLDSGPLDSGPLDSGPLDSGPLDSGPLDSGPLDSGPLDSGPLDSGPLDSGPLDSGPLDSGPLDSGPDTGSPSECLDQEHVGFSGGVFIQGVVGVAQTITFGRDGLFSRFEARLSGDAGPCTPPGDLMVQIFATDEAGVPTGPALQSHMIAPTAWAGTSLVVQIDPPLSVSVGGTVAVFIDTVGGACDSACVGPSSCRYFWFCSGEYERGEAFTSGDGISFDRLVERGDCEFRAFVETFDTCR